MPTSARMPAMSASVRARCFGLGVGGAGVEGVAVARGVADLGVEGVGVADGVGSAEGVCVTGGVSVGDFHYTKPSGSVSSACQTLVSCNSPHLVAVRSRHGVLGSRVSRNFARNSIEGIPSFEGRSLESQRFLACLKNDRWKLCAKFVGRDLAVAWGPCRRYSQATPSLSRSRFEL